MRTFGSRGAVAVVVVAAILALNSQSAFAEPSDGPMAAGAPVSADRLAAVVAGAQRHSGRPVARPLAPTQSGRLTALVTDQVKAGSRIGSELPARSSGKIVTTSRVADAPAQQVSVGLPREISGDRAAQVAANGTVAYPDPAGVVDVAAQTDREGSVRVHTILRTPDAPKAYTYPLSLPAGASAALDKDGGVRAVYRGRNAQGEAAEVKIGGFASPWAVDANGASVPTRYELDGKNLRQVVDTSGVTAWPVTADPTFWWGYSLTLSAGNASRLAAALALGAGVAGILTLLGDATIVGIPAGVLFTIAAGLLIIGSAVVWFCNADGTGIVINKAWVGPPWCTSA